MTPLVQHYSTINGGFFHTILSDESFQVVRVGAGLQEDQRYKNFLVEDTG